jgi:hypothetical protein
MRHRRAIRDICVVCRDFGHLKFRIGRVKEGPDRGGARGKVLRACRSIVDALERTQEETAPRAGHCQGSRKSGR